MKRLLLFLMLLQVFSGCAQTRINPRTQLKAPSNVDQVMVSQLISGSYRWGYQPISYIDKQTLTWDSGANELTISGGNTVDLSSLASSSLWSQTGNDIYYNLGRVGIGNSAPASAFHLTASTLSENIVRFENTLGNDAFAFDFLNGHGEFFIRNSGEVDKIVLRSAQDSYIDNGSNFGIGTDSPAATLDLQGSFKYDNNGNTFADGDVLTLDASGNVSAQSPSGGGGGGSGEYIVRDENLKTVYLPKGGDYTSSSNPATGAVKITLPDFDAAAHLNLKATIYEQTSGEYFVFFLAGYLLSDDSWNIASANQLAQSAAYDFTVRFGNESGSPCIWIGETTTEWKRPKVSVDYVRVQGSSSSNWHENWDVGIASTLGTVNLTVSQNLVQGKGMWQDDGTSAHNTLADEVRIGTNLDSGAKLMVKADNLGETVAKFYAESKEGVHIKDESGNAQLFLHDDSNSEMIRMKTGDDVERLYIKSSSSGLTNDYKSLNIDYTGSSSLFSVFNDGDIQALNSFHTVPSGRKNYLNCYYTDGSKGDGALLIRLPRDGSDIFGSSYGFFEFVIYKYYASGMNVVKGVIGGNWGSGNVFRPGGAISGNEMFTNKVRLMQNGSSYYIVLGEDTDTHGGSKATIVQITRWCYNNANLINDFTDSWNAFTSADLSSYTQVTELTSNIHFQSTSAVGGTGATNRVAYWSDANNLTSSDNLHFDGDSLGVGTNSPNREFHCTGGVEFDDEIVKDGEISLNTGSNQNNFNSSFLSQRSTLRLNPSADIDLTGIEAQVNGFELLLYNSDDTFTVTIKGEDSNSTDVNRFAGGDHTLQPGRGVRVRYSTNLNRWIILD